MVICFSSWAWWLTAVVLNTHVYCNVLLCMLVLHSSVATLEGFQELSRPCCQDFLHLTRKDISTCPWQEAHGNHLPRVKAGLSQQGVASG